MEHKEFRIRIPWPTARQVRPAVARWLPSRGNVLFTTLMILMLVWAQTAGAFPALNSAANSTGTIAYQGRLADSSGNPLTNTLNMSFRLYSTSTGGSPLWSELWTGSNGVQVSDGLFNVMLGSLTPIPQNVITGNTSLFLGITVGTDDEMSPRVQLGSVPFAVQALTVPAGSVTTEKLAVSAVTTDNIANGAVTSSKAPFALTGPADGYRVEVGTGPLETYSSTGFQTQKAIGFAQPFSEPPQVFIQIVDQTWGVSVFPVVVASTTESFQYRDQVLYLYGQPSISVRHYWIAIGH
ncbi:MAG: hypothetical protein WBO46_24915 [Caldilineaceae bacterium]